jgi:hypothetical protein
MRVALDLDQIFPAEPMHAWSVPLWSLISGTQNSTVLAILSKQSVADH